MMLFFVLLTDSAIAQTNCETCRGIKNPQLDGFRRYSIRMGASWEIPRKCTLPTIAQGGQTFQDPDKRCAFYECAGAAANNRFACNGESDYLINYGKKYCNRFTQATQEFLSDKARTWMNQVLLCLQTSLRRECVAGGVCSNCNTLRQFAFESHVACYTGRDRPDQGRIPGRISICDLSTDDMAFIFRTPTLKDLFTRAAGAQAFSVATICSSQYVRNPADLIPQVSTRLYSPVRSLRFLTGTD